MEIGVVHFLCVGMVYTFGPSVYSSKRFGSALNHTPGPHGLPTLLSAIAFYFVLIKRALVAEMTYCAFKRSIESLANLTGE